jgi:predicted N-acetyltransferase YhbS
MIAATLYRTMLELQGGALAGKSGTVKYHAGFHEGS